MDQIIFRRRARAGAPAWRGARIKLYTMESRANYALVGLFTHRRPRCSVRLRLLVQQWRGGPSTRMCAIIFSGTVTGLGRGSSVLVQRPARRRGHAHRAAAGRSAPDLCGGPGRQLDAAARRHPRPHRGAGSGRRGRRPAAGRRARRADVLKPAPGQNMPTIVAERSEFQDILETVRTIAKRADDDARQRRDAGQGKCRPDRQHGPQRREVLGGAGREFRRRRQADARASAPSPRRSIRWRRSSACSATS